ncbi:hypothetical protein ACJIZ3_013147 [Penstemon smallii]|uniref:Receptor-interacting protein n=1 Tax=Penstemon smallii TaxID=265156 RepID=A0ABD3UQB2_9LAMI
MNSIKSHAGNCQLPSAFKSRSITTFKTRLTYIPQPSNAPNGRGRKKLTVEANSDGGAEKRTSFLTLEEAGLVEISGLSSHERFLCRLTISSLNLLRVISEQEGCEIEELNAGKVCDWFLKDKLKKEQNPDSAVLQWGESEFPL